MAKDKGKVIEKLKSVICTEHTIHTNYNRLVSLIKNGRIRDKLRSHSTAAKRNKNLLIEQLNSLGVNSYVAESPCKFCKITPEDFSLIGALDLGLEVTTVAIKFYRDLLHLSDDVEKKDLFKRLLKDKITQKNFLKREKRFPHRNKKESDLIYNYCIPEVISKLWR